MIDRANLPKLSEMPLVFVLSGGSRTITAEIVREATLEYREASTGPRLLALQRREDFLQAVEAAVEEAENLDLIDNDRVTLGWEDLYPSDRRG
jgi:hypothetical protein